ncbi:hypothetical protein M3Y99_00948600 [Aphelenchoides fujianensis]|nr:hypothetical protein M3Y99_00948600 [Aphelenchoides fujianensis]
MAQLTGDRDTVQFWNPYWQAEPPDFQRWFDYTVGCPANIKAAFKSVWCLISTKTAFRTIKQIA